MRTVAALILAAVVLSGVSLPVLAVSPPPVDTITLESVANNSISSASGSTGLVFSHTTGSGSNQVIVFAVMRRGLTQAITSVEWCNDALTQAGTTQTNGAVDASIWYRVNPDVGTCDVEVNWASTTGTSVFAQVVNLNNVDQGDPIDGTPVGANGSSTGPMTVDITTTVANTWIVDGTAMRILTSGDTATMTSMTNRTQRLNNHVDTAVPLRGLSSTVGPAATATTYTMEWTKSYDHSWAIVAAAFQPSTTATSSPQGIINNPVRGGGVRR